MTAAEMKYEFLILYDKYFEYGSPAYDDKQISTVLTKAEQRVFKRNYEDMLNKFREGFEDTELKRRGLDNLIKSTTISSTSAGIHPNGYILDLPADFALAIEESVITSNSGGSEITVKPVEHDFYTRNINNPYKKPDTDLAWRMDIGKTGSTKRTEIITDGGTITSYRLEYLKQPAGIVVDELTPANDVDSELGELLHHEIVDEAIKIAVSATSPEDYQISVSEQKLNES